MNAELLAATYDGDQTSLRFHVPGNNAVFRFSVARTVIGATYPQFSESHNGEYGYACVCAERLFIPRSAHTRQPSRYFAIIDEGDARSSSDFLSLLISLKDRYLCQLVFCPTEPETYLDDVRRLEGLAYYDRQRTDPEIKAMFPTYVSRTTVAGIVDRRTGQDSMQADLDMWLSLTVRDPDTGQPVLDGDGNTMPGLFAMRELKTEKASGALSRGLRAEPEIGAAIALAVRGLMDSRARTRPRLLDEDKTYAAKPGTGY